jgi:hypothetical protein
VCDYVIFVAVKILMRSLADCVYVLCNPSIVLDLVVILGDDCLCTIEITLRLADIEIPPTLARDRGDPHILEHHRKYTIVFSVS